MQRGAAAAKNFIISMEFWVLVQERGGGRAGAHKNATELMGGLAVLLVQKRACLKLGRKRGRINKKWMTIHLLLIGVQFSFIFTSSIMTSTLVPPVMLIQVSKRWSGHFDKVTLAKGLGRRRRRALVT